MSEKDFTYAKAGVDRELRAEAKKGLERLLETYKFNIYGEPEPLPYGKISPIDEDHTKYLDVVIEGIGTKVLLAQLADKYDTIGIDGVAMAVNDVIRSGARPIILVDNIHAQVSDPYLVDEWMKGIVKGAKEAECPVVGGEIGDVKEVIKGVKEGKGFDMVIACIGLLFEDDIIRGDDIKPGDVVIGLRSSGVHSNGISMVREVLFKEWGGKYDPYDRPDGLDRELIYEVLEPTRIYVKPVLKINKKYEVKAAVHITGDAYLKFDKLMNFSKEIGFEFNNFKPQPIFQVVQDTAPKVSGRIPDKEMLKTFNMGWGFAKIVREDVKNDVIDTLEKDGVEAEQIGRVTDTGKIIALYKGKKIELK